MMLFDIKPQLEKVPSPEPSIRELIFFYYQQYFGALEATKLTEQYTTEVRNLVQKETLIYDEAPQKYDSPVALGHPL